VRRLQAHPRYRASIVPNSRRIDAGLNFPRISDETVSATPGERSGSPRRTRAPVASISSPPSTRQVAIAFSRSMRKVRSQTRSPSSKRSGADCPSLFSASRPTTAASSGPTSRGICAISGLPIATSRRGARRVTAKSNVVIEPTKKNSTAARPFRSVAELTIKLRRWEDEYNHRRPHLALAGRTPAERLCELRIRREPVQMMA